MFRSSFFKISSHENLVEDENFAIATQVHDEFSCASMCSSYAVCHYALFDKDSKKCSFVKAREKRNPLDSEESDSRKVILEKVSRHGALRVSKCMWIVYSCNDCLKQSQNIIFEASNFVSSEESHPPSTTSSVQSIGYQ